MNALIQAGAGLTTNIASDFSRLVTIASEWQTLHEHSPGATPFQRPEWILAWVEAFSPQCLLVVEVRDQGRLIGLVPLLIYSRDKDRVLAFAGGGISDYLSHLAESGREAEVVCALFSCIRCIPDWTLLELTDIPGRSPLLSLDVFRNRLQEHDFCSVLPLPASEEELLHVFSNRHRANLRLARSRLMRAGSHSVELATAVTLPEFLEELFRLHASRWARSGESGVLSDERTRAFHNSCAPALAAKGVLKLHRLRVQERTIAVIYSLWERGTVYCYLQGFDPGYSFLSPGTYLMYEVIREAVNHGMHRFDFLRGQERYKQHWRGEPQATFRLSLSRADLLAFAT